MLQARKVNHVFVMTEFEKYIQSGQITGEELTPAAFDFMLCRYNLSKKLAGVNWAILIYGTFILFQNIRDLNMQDNYTKMLVLVIGCGYLYYCIPTVFCFAVCFSHPKLVEVEKLLEENIFINNVLLRHQRKRISLLDESAQCTICIGEFAHESEMIELPCSKKHCFHEECIKHWLQSHSTCPICRQDIRLTGLV